jgi:lipoate-protein ligase A
MRQWRLIFDPPTSGAENMARDEAILAAVGAGAQPPTLRLYDWQPPTLSLGYAQRARDVDQVLLAAQGWGLVRRPTGGRAILHIDELTYSLALPDDDPLAAGGIIESYREISRALLAALTLLGASTAADRRAERVADTGPVCFETPSHYEITTGGRKLVGSAQVRRKGGILQHGSLPLRGDVARICDGLAYPDESARAAAKEKVRGRAATLADALGGREVTWDAAAEAVARGVVETFGVTFITASLSEAEAVDAARLAEEQYGSEAYTFQR